MSLHYNSLLCLGDSYTIGEGVPLHHSFPYQTIQLLRSEGAHFHAPEIVAKTGWTSTELAEHILHTRLNEHYDFVTLLIGVNNQYRGLSIDDYKTDFEFLLKKAIHFAHNDVNRVIVLSIPDWSVTPFAKERAVDKIAAEINAFNLVCEQITERHKVCFVNITPSTRQAKDDATVLTTDGLHYSGKEMRDWAEIVATIILDQLKRN